MSITFTDIPTVQSLTGARVTPAQFSQSVGIVGSYIEQEITDVWYADLSVKDQTRIRTAIAWQSTYTAPTVTQHPGAKSISSGDQSISYGDVSSEDIFLHPLALRALNRLSWRSKRTIKPKPYLEPEPNELEYYLENDGYNAFNNEVVRTAPEDSDIWHQFGYSE